MATEADFLLRHGDFPPDGIVQILWLQIFVAGGEIQPGNGRVVAHGAFIAAPVVLQNPGLRARAKIPRNRQRNRPRPIGHAVCALPFAGFHRVGIRTLANRHLRDIPQNRIRARQRHGPPHRRLRLALRPLSVA